MGPLLLLGLATDFGVRVGNAGRGGCTRCRIVGYLVWGAKAAGSSSFEQGDARLPRRGSYCRPAEVCEVLYPGFSTRGALCHVLVQLFQNVLLLQCSTGTGQGAV